jgi:hypothetical protein
MRDITPRGFTIEMVPGVRIEVTAIRIAVAITTDGGIGIATLEATFLSPHNRGGGVTLTRPSFPGIRRTERDG